MGLTKQEALELFASDDVIGIGMEATAVRNRKNDPRLGGAGKMPVASLSRPE